MTADRGVKVAFAVVAAAVIALVVVLALALGGGDGGDSGEPAPAATEAPSGGATPSSPGGLPPELVECMAEQGFDIESQADLHSAPPQVLQGCFGSLHEGGGSP